MKTGHFYSTGNSKEKRRQLQTVSCCNFIKLPQITTVTRAKTLFLSKVSAWKCKVDRTADGHSGGANAPGRFPLLPLHPRPLPPRHQRQRLHQTRRDSLPETEPGLAEVALPETEFSAGGRRQLLPGRHSEALPPQGE